MATATERQDKLAEAIEDAAFRAQVVSDELGNLAVKIREGVNGSKEAKAEIEELRTRLQNEMDYTLRQQRELNKQVRCPSCGHLHSRR